MKSLLKLSSVLAIALCLVTASNAAPITPVGTSFGALPGATFNGTDIPNGAVQIWTNGTITLGLTATQRYENPTVTNNGAGTFYATTGNDAANGKPTYGTWNFDFYVSGLAEGQFAKLVLYYGGDTSLNSFTLPNYQESWNLGMGFLTGVVPFDPSVAGSYGFGLEAYSLDGNEAFRIGQSSILVNVSSVPDSGSTLLMLGGSLAMGLFLRRRLSR